VQIKIKKNSKKNIRITTIGAFYKVQVYSSLLKTWVDTDSPYFYCKEKAKVWAKKYLNAGDL
jgi:hypothetical protein